MLSEMKNSQGGQVLLIVVLVMVVSLTIGLSVISRSITNVRTSTDEANSAQALAAAEAGIQQALQSNVAVAETNFTDNRSSYKTDVDDALVTSIPLNGGNLVVRDEGIDLWLVSHDISGAPDYANPWGNSDSLDIFWGDEDVSISDCTQDAALEVLLIKGPLVDPEYSRYAVDPCGTRPVSNNFEAALIAGSYSAAGKSFRNKYTISSITEGFVVRIVPIYNNAVIAVAGGAGAPALPSQGSLLVSTGSAGDVKRKLNVFQGYSYLPIEFSSYGIFSPTDE